MERHRDTFHVTGIITGVSNLLGRPSLQAGLILILFRARFSCRPSVLSTQRLSRHAWWQDDVRSGEVGFFDGLNVVGDHKARHTWGQCGHESWFLVLQREGPDNGSR